MLRRRVLSVVCCAVWLCVVRGLLLDVDVCVIDAVGVVSVVCCMRGLFAFVGCCCC